MKQLPAAVAAHLSAGGGVACATLVWITAKNRTTGDPETLGLWTGYDDRAFTIGGASRAYFGGGQIIDCGPFEAAVDGQVQRWQLSASAVSPDITDAIRAYETRRAPIEVHSVYFDPFGTLPLADPVLEFRGRISELTLPVPAIGQEGTISLTAVSSSVDLSLSLSLTRSDAALQDRAPGDTFRQYNALTGVQVAWGSLLAKAPGSGNTGDGGGFGGGGGGFGDQGR